MCDSLCICEPFLRAKIISLFAPSCARNFGPDYFILFTVRTEFCELFFCGVVLECSSHGRTLVCVSNSICWAHILTIVHWIVHILWPTDKTHLRMYATTPEIPFNPATSLEWEQHYSNDQKFNAFHFGWWIFQKALSFQSIFSPSRCRRYFASYFCYYSIRKCSAQCEILM